LSKKLPKEVVAHWPEVFGSVEIKSIPVEYLESVNVTFDGGEIWEITMDQRKLLKEGTTVDEVLNDLLAEYEDTISKVDFRVHTDKVKRDMIKTTRKFMKGKFRKPKTDN
jgi:hypothetical protein